MRPCAPPKSVPLARAGLLVALLALLPAAAAPANTTTNAAAVADAYTSASAPATNYGGSTSLRAAGDPTRIGFVRFNPQDLAGTVTKATLRVYSGSRSSSGFNVHSVSTAWEERTLTHANRPAVSETVLSRSGPLAKNKYVSLDVTQAVTGNGAVSFALTAADSSDIVVASREAGSSRSPSLTVETIATEPSSEPSLEPSPEPSPEPSVGVGMARRPYDVASPWNTPIGPDPVVDSMSAVFVNAIADNGLPLTSDPDQYTIPVYRFDDQTPRRTVKLSGYFSSYDAGDDSRVGYGFAPTISGVPIPDDALQSAGTDGQIVFWDPATDTEYSFWRFAKDAAGNYTATNGYRYHTGSGYFGRFADGKAGRGAGTPYFAGLVRKWEIDQGRIDHALAFAYDSPAGWFRYPASKSDGVGITGVDLPEGARLQLNPSLTDADFTRWGLSPAAKTIARALQSYGMYVVDNSGSSKVYLEDRITAGWGTDINRHLLSNIPWNQFRVIAAHSAP